MSNSVKTEAWVGILEDSLDAVMLVGSVIYFVVITETSLRLAPETMAAIGGAGGTLRLIMRRLIRRIVEVKIVAHPQSRKTIVS